MALPSRELHRRLPEIARDDDVVIIDTPQIEDHAAIARSALRYADEIVIPCAPTPIEINRTSPVREEIAEVRASCGKPARSAVLLNRCITRAHSTSDAQAALEGLGYEVLATAVPRLEVYAQSPTRWTCCCAAITTGCPRKALATAGAPLPGNSPPRSSRTRVPSSRALGDVGL